MGYNDVHALRGFITTVQRMSVHDGPGIRSTVFMKGCNMRCAWCHNPETLAAGPQLQHIGPACRLCGSCVQSCPAGALSIHDGVLEIDRSLCTMCGKCADACLNGAMNIVGESVTVAGLLERLMADKVFYETSGGGVTVSGGEPFLQHEFVCGLLAECRCSGLATAVETNLSLPWTIYERAVGLVDLWMCDIKCMDPECHRKWTGAGNDSVRENIGHLASAGTEILVRTPVIPGVNDSPDEIDRICRFLRGFGGNLRYELLGFHTLGFGKYKDLGMANAMKGTEDMSSARLAQLREILDNYGF